ARRKAAKAGCPHKSHSTSINAQNFLRTIRASTRKMWGSNDERDEFAKKLDAMCIARGSPSLFWTFTPNPDGSLLFAFWSAKDLPNGRPQNLDSLSPENMPSPTSMTIIVSKNPVLQANYYWHCVEALIEVLFAWDIKARRPKKQRGIFGHIEEL